MSVDALYLIPVPPEILASAKYAVIDDLWKGDDYVILVNEGWDDRLERSAARRRRLALDITRGYLRALQASEPPRSILVHADASAPEARPRAYRLVRELWLDAGALALPDVTDEVVVLPEERRTPKPVAAEEIRVPLPEGTKRARLRQLDPEFVLRDVRGRRPKRDEVVKTRAATLSIEAEAPFGALRAHYLAALQSLGLNTKEDTKWIDFDGVSIRGQKKGLIVTVSIQPRKAKESGFDVGLTWIVTSP